MQYKQPWKICCFHDVCMQLQKINLYSILLFLFLLSLLLFFSSRFYKILLWIKTAQQISYFVCVHVCIYTNPWNDKDKNIKECLSCFRFFDVLSLSLCSSCFSEYHPYFNSDFIMFLIFKNESLNFQKQVNYHCCFPDRKNEAKEDELTYWWSYNVNHGIFYHDRGSLSVPYTL